jgi:hypothetical protein
MTSIQSDDADDFSSDYENEDTASDRSESVSDISGDPHTAPSVMWFGAKECQVLTTRKATGTTRLLSALESMTFIPSDNADDVSYNSADEDTAILRVIALSRLLTATGTLTIPTPRTSQTLVPSQTSNLNGCSSTPRGSPERRL